MSDNIPPAPPPHRSPCICGSWTWTGKHWTFIINSQCPVHGNPD